MALFPRNADDAIQCSLEMLDTLEDYNKQNLQQEAVKIGIGINTGLLMLGTVGEPQRLAATVISDAVNTAARIESLTKKYQVPLLISEDTYKKLHNPAMYAIERVDQVLVKGKQNEITIYNVKSK
jgi:class 3 adenylate cyclase